MNLPHFLVAVLGWVASRPVAPGTGSKVAREPRVAGEPATLGASRLRTFFRVILPLSVPGLVTGVALSFAHTLGEFGVVLMVGETFPESRGPFPLIFTTKFSR